MIKSTLQRSHTECEFAVRSNTVSLCWDMSLKLTDVVIPENDMQVHYTVKNSTALFYFTIFSSSKSSIRSSRVQTEFAENKRIFLPWPAMRERRWAWWSRNTSASVGSCRWLDTWWTPSPPGTRPHIPWIYWCLQEERSDRDITWVRARRKKGRACVRCSSAPEWSDWALRLKNSDINTVLALVNLVRCFLLLSYGLHSLSVWI